MADEEFEAQQRVTWPVDDPLADGITVTTERVVGSPRLGFRLAEAPRFFWEHHEHVGGPLSRAPPEYKEAQALEKLLDNLRIGYLRATCWRAEDDPRAPRWIMPPTLWTGLIPRCLDLEESCATDASGRRFTHIRVFGSKYPPPEAQVPPIHRDKVLSDVELAEGLKASAAAKRLTRDEYLVAAGKLGAEPEQAKRVIEQLPDEIRPRQGRRKKMN